MAVKCLERKQKAEIVAWYDAGETMKALATRFHVSDTTILNVLLEYGYEPKSRGAEGERGATPGEKRAYERGYHAGWNARRRREAKKAV